MVRDITKVLPGKMAEYMQLQETYIAIATRHGMPSMRRYRCFSGGGDTLHTIIAEIEVDSLAALEAILEKMFADPEMPALQAKLEAILQGHEVEFYVPIP